MQTAEKCPPTPSPDSLGTPSFPVPDAVCFRVDIWGLAGRSAAAIVHHRFGQGRAIWVACGMEGGSQWVDQQLVRAMLRRVFPGPCRFEVRTHPAVEMTLFHQPDKKRLLAGLLNLQQQLPQAPVPATVRVFPPDGQKIRRILRLPKQEPVAFSHDGPYVQFHVEPFDTIAMFALDY